MADARYVLTDDDRRLVAATTERVPPEAKPRLIAIHRSQIAVAEAKLAEAAGMAQQYERVVAFRTAAIAALEAGGDTDG